MIEALVRMRHNIGFEVVRGLNEVRDIHGHFFYLRVIESFNITHVAHIARCEEVDGDAFAAKSA